MKQSIAKRGDALRRQAFMLATISKRFANVACGDRRVIGIDFARQQSQTGDDGVKFLSGKTNFDGHVLAPVAKTARVKDGQ